MTDDGDAKDETIANGSIDAQQEDESFAGFAASREEYIFGDDDDNDDTAESVSGNMQDYEEVTLAQLNGYPSNVDYYAILGLPRNPPPSDNDIRSAYRLLSPSFHPDKHPRFEQKAIETFQRLETAYEVLIDPQKRITYDMLGADGVKREWDEQRGNGLRLNRNNMVGMRAMDADEFKEWFIGKMRERERTVLEGMVGNRVGEPRLVCVRICRRV